MFRDDIYDVKRYLMLYGRIPGQSFTIDRDQEFPFSITQDATIPPGEIHFRIDGKTIGKITNIASLEEEREDG